MGLSEKPHGTLPDGTDIVLHTITNSMGWSVSVSTYGATITSIRVPDSAGKLGEVVLGHDTLAPYLCGASNAYFGCTVGRVANRIAHGKFRLDQVHYQLATNDGPNHLHGGVNGFDKRVWLAVSAQEDHVTFALNSEPNEEDYPSSLDATVTFTLNDSGELTIEYEATTDQATLCNLTNHSYFNLAGFGTVHDHCLSLAAQFYTPVDATLIPTGEVLSVIGTPFDFYSGPQCIGERLGMVEGTNGGYDHNYVLSKTEQGALEPFCTVSEPLSGRKMTVSTSAPACQFYTGNFLDGTIKGRAGQTYGKHAGFCLETQSFPDSPNHPHFPSIVLRAGETYAHTTVFKFSTK